MDELRYVLAFREGDVQAMNRLLAQGRLENNRLLLLAASSAEAAYGRLNHSRDYMTAAVQSAQRSDFQGLASYALAQAALVEADFGNAEAAHRAASESLAGAHGLRASGAVLALARAGYVSEAQIAADQMVQRYPVSTILNVYWLPTIQASIELRRKNPQRAIELLRITSPYELSDDGLLEPIYTRGLAYLQLNRGDKAAAEFHKLLDHPGILGCYPRAALAHLGMARAHVLQGDATEAREEYQKFLELWKDADPDIPIYQQAKAEYEKLP